MLNKSLLVLVLVGLGLVACSSETAEVVGEQYGQDLALVEVIPVNEVFTKVNDLNGKIVRVSGTVSDLCKHKGCWIQVKDGEKVLTIRFKDEAFTLPASAIGRKIDFEGLLIAEKIKNPLAKGGACADGGEHSGGEVCENERAEKVAKTSEMRYTMISTGLVLL